MIPVRLRLRNFMCYRDNVPPLLFDGFRVACLSGDNGNGKSALLDAITWALWGEARSKTDDELIHLGQSEMEVEFEFLLGDLHYRVLRKRVKPRSGRGAGQTVLELQVASDGEFHPITGNSVRETEQKIVDLLRMQYQTFINSAFLLQGRADEFTTKSPTERKKVLADILGLAYYDTLEERAKQQARQKEAERRELLAALAEIDRELEHRPEYEMELAQIRAALDTLETDIELQDARVSALRERQHALDLIRQQVEAIDASVTARKRELAESRTLEASAQRRLAEYSKLLDNREEIEAGYGDLKQLRVDLDVLSQKLSQYTGINEHISKVEREIERVRGKLLSEKNLLAHTVAESEAKASARPELEAELVTLREKAKEVETLEVQLAEKREQMAEAAGRLHSLKAANIQFRQEMEDLKDKMSRLEQGGEKCPLCETDLGVEGKQRLAENYRLQGEAKRDAYRRNEAEVKGLTAQQAKLQRDIDDLQARVHKDRGAIQRREATVEKSLSEAEAASEGLVADRQKLAALESALTEESFASDERHRVALLRRQLEELGYDFVEHEEKRKRAKELQPMDDRHRRLEEAAKLVTQEREALQRAQASIERHREAMVAEEQQRIKLQEELAKLASAREELEQAQVTLANLIDKRSHSRQLLGAAHQRLDHCLYLEKQKKVKQETLEQVVAEKAVYDELALAFGKKGIQAMIIEAVIPEIEEEANAILARMTDNRMHVAIETQRDTKRGDSVETLEIKISDELGTRNYELYSGGEAFRVNFAIRVALSKLLARRAGARLQMLVIDEGFGTQDAAGREKLVETINSVQEDFEKILVITHIQELKDAFPVRIDVMKTADGSTLSIF